MSGLKIIISDGTNTEVIERKNINLDELGSNTFTFTSGELGEVSSVKEVSIAPILKSESGKEFVGNVADAEESKPLSCLDLLNSGTSADGKYTIDPDGLGDGDDFEVYCYMTGDWPGATLVISRPQSVAGNENQVGAIGDSPPTASSTSYSKFDDSIINAIKATSSSTNSYIARATKTDFTGGPGSYCVGFIRKSCDWAMSGTPGPNCNNAWQSQSSTTYCSRVQTHGNYRGVDGHTCANSDGATAWGSYRDAANQFMIFEHGGGPHYCGGWDTTWSKIELLIR